MASCELSCNNMPHHAASTRKRKTAKACQVKRKGQCSTVKHIKPVKLWWLLQRKDHLKASPEGANGLDIRTLIDNIAWTDATEGTMAPSDTAC